MVPSLRTGLAGSVYGTSFATGLPARPMTTSAPHSTRWISLDRWVFASWMLVTSMTRLSLVHLSGRGKHGDPRCIRLLKHLLAIQQQCSPRVHGEGRSADFAHHRDGLRS